MIGCSSCYYTPVIAVLLSVSILFYPVMAVSAKEPIEIELRYAPSGTRTWLISDNQWAVCYNLHEYRTILELDANMYSVSEKYRLVHDLELDYQSIISEKDEVIKSLREDKRIVVNSCVRVQDRWDECELALEKKYRGWPYIVGSAVIVTVVVGLMTGFAVRLAMQ